MGLQHLWPLAIMALIVQHGKFHGLKILQLGFGATVVCVWVAISTVLCSSLGRSNCWLISGSVVEPKQNHLNFAFVHHGTFLTHPYMITTGLQFSLILKTDNKKKTSSCQSQESSEQFTGLIWFFGQEFFFFFFWIPQARFPHNELAYLTLSWLHALKVKFGHNSPPKNIGC